MPYISLERVALLLFNRVIGVIINGLVSNYEAVKRRGGEIFLAKLYYLFEFGES